MQQKKQPKNFGHCPHHGTPLKRRRGCQSHKWVYFCPEDDCNHERKAS